MTKPQRDIAVAIRNAVLIITHPGGAHRDEFLACCLVLALAGPSTKIVRRDPIAAELVDARIAVIDVGGHADHELLNFDHHQLPRTAPPTCACSQVLDGLGLLEEARQSWGWVSVTEILDSKGPSALGQSVASSLLAGMGFASHYPGEAKKPGVWKALRPLFSPVEAFLIRLFRETYEVAPGDMLHGLMRRLGQDLLDELGRRTERRQRLDKGAKVIRTHGLVVVDARCVDRDDSPTFGLEEWVEANHGDAAVTITQDDRGDGLCLFRREDHPRVDFSRLEGQPGVVFAHKGGFVAKLGRGVDPLPMLEAAIK